MARFDFRGSDVLRRWRMHRSHPVFRGTQDEMEIFIDNLGSIEEAKPLLKAICYRLRNQPDRAGR